MSNDGGANEKLDPSGVAVDSKDRRHANPAAIADERVRLGRFS